jgi:hypothetical protein
VIPDTAPFALRHDLVTRQLDDVNVLGEALVMALHKNVRDLLARL